MNQSQAFDSLAADYDADFTESIIGRYLRNRVHERLQHHFAPGTQVLELGCGTGEDALWLAKQRVYVTATDSSNEMLRRATQKAGPQPNLSFQQLDLHTWLANDIEANRYEGAFSNFGPLNCLTEWKTLAHNLSKILRPGGIAAFGVMSPACLWEPIWHGLHGNWRTATRRWKKTVTFQPTTPIEGIQVSYPSIRRLRQDMEPYFECVQVMPLGVFVPPSDVYGAVEKRRWLLDKLLFLEKHLGHHALLAPFGDHYWIEFRKRSQ
jgi:ubiquinone/menaquinone biosynthesis C-methylase UbiE